MRLCLLTIPGRTDNPRLGVAGPNSVVLDANELHATALAGHMDAKRAYELADALVPADLYGFIRNGRHGWRAIELALEFLGPAATDTELESPRGQRIVFHSSEVELRPVLHRDTGTVVLEAADRGVVRTPISYGAAGERLTCVSYALGGVDHVEYAALISRMADHVDDTEAWEHVGGYVKLAAANGWQAFYVHSVDELDAVGDTDVFCELADAISALSSQYRLDVGDIVRTGTRGAEALLDLTAAANLGPVNGDDVGGDVLERLLTRVDS